MARAVADNGGSVMHVAIPPEKQQQLIKSLRNNKELKPMNIRASSLKRRTTGSYKNSVHGFKIHVVGKDR